MNKQMTSNPNVYALLIGIDLYMTNRLPDGSFYPSLGGCAHDVNQLEEFLKYRLGATSEHILKLTATNTGNYTPPEPPEYWPTYENMVKAFKDLTARAQPGDQVYIHYSGHGGRSSTIFTQFKETDELDYSLVPVDIGAPGTRYLRDVELAHLIKAMTGKGLRVTLVIDSCHSGGATRGEGGADVRGISSIDTTQRPGESLVATHDELAATWLGLTSAESPGTNIGSGWLPGVKDYALLAACRLSESAYEYAFDGEQRNGVLTYWLLESLWKGTSDLTVKQAHSRILAKVHSRFTQQTPQLEGAHDRLLFPGQWNDLSTFRVLEVDAENRRVLLDAGQAHGTRPGAKFVIYPQGETDFSRTDKSLAIADIKEVGATESWVYLLGFTDSSDTPNGLLEPGARAVYLSPETLLRASSRVRLARQSEEIVPPHIDQELALNRITEALKREHTNFISLVEQGRADYQVAVNPDNEYEIWDPAGNLIPNLRPALRTDDHGAPARLVQRLIHLSKYRSVLLLENCNTLSPLAGKIHIELKRESPDDEAASQQAPPVPTDFAGLLTLNIGERVALRVRNDSQQTLSVSLLDLQPDWAISQIHQPLETDNDYELLEPGEALEYILTVALPSGYQEGADVIKVFATTEGTSFRWLELPPIDYQQTPTRGSTRGGGRLAPSNPLEELITGNSEDAEALDIALLAAQRLEWTTAQVEVRIVTQKPPAEQIKELEQQTIEYFQEGKYEKAIEVTTQARDLIRQHLGEQTTDFASNLNTLATLFKQVGRYAAAEPLYHQALTIQRTLSQEAHPDYAETLDNLAELYRETGRYPEAESLYDQALKIYRVRVSQGQNKRDCAITLNNLALLYQASGDYNRSEPLLLEARDMVKELSGEDHLDFAAVIGNLGELYRLMARYDEAETLFKRSLEIVRTARGANDPALPSKLNNLALLYKTIGDYDAAMPLFTEALNILRTSLKTDHPYFAQTTNNLAELYRAMGQYEEAEELYRQALDIKKRSLGTAHPSYGESLSNLAELRSEKGQYDEAKSLYAQALDILRILGESHPVYAASLVNMARLRHLLGEYEQAEQLYRQALDIQRGVLNPGHLDIARSLSNLAELCLETSRDAEAQSLYDNALEIRRKALGSDNPEVAVSYCDLARAYRRMGNYAAAEPLYRQASRIQRISLGEEHPAFVQTLNNLALVLAATGREKEAMEFGLRAVGLEDSMIELIFSIGSERQRKIYLAAIEENFHMILSLALHCFKESPATVREIFDLVLRRKAIMVEALAAQPELALIDRYPQLALKLKELIGLRTQIAQKILQTPAGLIAQQQLLSDWYTQKERLEGELAQEIPEIKLGRQLRTVDRRRVALALPEKSVLVEFIRLNVYDFRARYSPGGQNWTAARYLAFILPAREPDKVQLVDLGEAEPIDRLINGFRTSILSEADPSATPSAGLVPEMSQQSTSEHATALRAKVFDPLVPLLDGQTYLVIAPEGNLVSLPFAALPLDEGYLIDKYHFRYLHTGRDALRFDILPTSAPTETLIIADPDYDLAGATRKKVRRTARSGTEELSSFARLPGTRVEAELIASILQVRPWLGDKALEASLKAFRSPRILHLAAHGFLLPDKARDLNQDSLDFGVMVGPGVDSLARLRSHGAEHSLRRSGIALAGANTWLRGGDLPTVAEDGLLTVEEILSLDLSGTELVTLSACQTGYGDSAAQSVVSLQRAFLIAGAKMLVMNLWQVPDEQTAELMQEFYRRIAEGKSQARALQQAQSAIRSKFPSPYYWGAFVCLGDLAPLPVRRTEFVRASDPYVAGPPVTSDSLFVGRTDILKIIQDNLAPAAGQNILLLRGQRRTGKTSVLLRLSSLLKKDAQSAFVPAVVDIQGLMGSKNEAEFFYGLALNMEMELAELDVEVPPYSQSDFEKSPTLNFEFKFLKLITNKLGNRRILLMLDEFDRIKTLIDSGRLGAEVLDFFRHLMQHTPVLFLIAGTYKLLELTGDYFSVFFNLTKSISIGKLPERDTRELITEPVKPWYTIESSAVDEIVRVAGCHPYFTQLVCKTLLEVRNESGLNQMTLNYVEDAVKRALESGETNIGYPWTETDCTNEERLILGILAGEDEPTNHVSMESISRQLAEAHISLPIGSVIKRLTERGIVQQDGDTRLTFVVPLFQRWLKQKRYDSLAAARRYNEEHSTPTTSGGTFDV